MGTNTRRDGLGPLFILLSLIAGLLLFFVISDFRSCERDESSDGETCRMTLPAACYETSEAAAAAAFRGNIRPRKLDEEYAQTVGSIINRVASYPNIDRHPILRDVLLNKRLRNAASAILAMEEPPCAWRWDDVRSTVERFGKSIPIVRPRWDDQVQFARVPMAFIPSPPTLIVNPDLVGDMSDGEITSILVHEATHGVFDALAAQTASLSREQLRAATILCGTFNAQMTHIHEGLATWNQLRSYARIEIDEAMREHVGAYAIQAMADFDQGRPKAFARVMAYNLAIRMEESGDAQGLLRNCDYPPIFDGENRGRAFIPNGVDDPLVNAFGLATRLFL
jgi:hypothetical protein